MFWKLVEKEKQHISFFWKDTRGHGFQTPHLSSFLHVSDFVEQTSSAATGAASIIVNDAGKCFCHWDSKSSFSCRIGLVCACVLLAHSFLLLHAHTICPCIRGCHLLTKAQVTVITGYTHTRKLQTLKCTKPCWVSTGSSLLQSKAFLLESSFCSTYSQVMWGDDDIWKPRRVHPHKSLILLLTLK